MRGGDPCGRPPSKTVGDAQAVAITIFRVREKHIMSMLNLSPDELLTTTRSVRKRLDFSRPVEPELLRECLEIAVQAPTGGNRQNWHFIIVTDRQQIQALGEIYKKGWAVYLQIQASARAAQS